MRIAISGVIGYVAITSVLLSATPLGWPDALFLSALIELLPVFALVQVGLARDITIERVQAYMTSSVTVLLLGVGSVVLGSRLVGMGAMGLRVETGQIASLLAWSVGIFAFGVGTLWFFLAIRKRCGWDESRLVRELMPVTRREKGLYAGLSLCAGLGEELAYRAYAIPALMVAGGSASVALAVTSTAFAVLHSYQGMLGVVRTGVVGMIMGAVFLQTGSVWPPVAAHILIDVAVGFVLADRLLS